MEENVCLERADGNRGDLKARGNGRKGVCMRRYITMYKIEFLLFLRDFFSVFFTLIFPALMLVLFGGIYGNDPLYPGAEVGAMDSSVPAYCVMVIGVTGLMAFPLTLAGYKEKKIYKRFDATPVGKKSIMLTQVSVNLIMTLIGIGILLVMGKLLYDVRIQGLAFEVFVSLLFSVAAMFSMGFLFTALGKDAKIANLLCYLSYFIMLFLSGATIPDMFFSGAVKRIAAFLPMTYAVDLMQGVFAGERLGGHGKELLILGAVAAGCAAIGSVLYRKKDWA